MLGPGDVHIRKESDYLLWVQFNPNTTDKCFHLSPSTRCSMSSEKKLTWAWWRICTESGQWWGRTQHPPRPWRRDFVPPSPKRGVRWSDSPLRDTMQRSSQNTGTKDHGPSSKSGSNSPLSLEIPTVFAHDKEKKIYKEVTTCQVWFRVRFWGNILQPSINQNFRANVY